MSKIIPKKVEMIELFYDLIFVYAIAQVTSIIHHPHHGHVETLNIFQYVTVCLIILQIWLYQTNYINRFGRSSVKDNILLCINMGATIYLANSINTEWSTTFYSFNIAMIIMLLSVIFQFASHLNVKEAHKELQGFITTLSVEVVLIAIGLYMGYEKGLIIVLIGAAAGILLPTVTTRKHLETTRTNFPHLVERMGLIIIITFGEMIIGITKLFDTSKFSMLPILVFASVVLLFSNYVIQMDKLVNHHQHNKGLVLLYSHFGILISLGFITVSWGFLIDSSVDRTFIVEFMLLGLISFYLFLFVNSVYNKENKKFSAKEFMVLIANLVVTSVALFIFKDNNIIFATIMLLSATLVTGFLYSKMKK